MKSIHFLKKVYIVHIHAFMAENIETGIVITVVKLGL